MKETLTSILHHLHIVLNVSGFYLMSNCNFLKKQISAWEFLSLL